MGVVNWGIYFGNGLSYVVGTYVPPLNILGQVSLWSVESDQLIGCFTVSFFHRQGWRWAYYLTGIPGFLLAFLLLVTTSDPGKSPQQLTADQSQQFVDEDSGNPPADGTQDDEKASNRLFQSSIWLSLRCFFTPSILLLCLAACVRQTGNIHFHPAKLGISH